MPTPNPAPTALTYPLPVPEVGSLTTVAPGVHWIRLALPYKLDHINVWALEQDDGWTLVDTGIRTEDTVATWRQLTSRPPLDRPLRRVIATHMHPDHVGMAGWLTRQYGVELWISRLEYLSCRTLMSDTAREAPADAVKFCRRAGWSEQAIESYRARFGNFGRHIHALPDSFRRIRDGDRIRIGAHEWEVVTGYGHSPEHSCLYCRELGLFISGDQVLPKISSNVSVHPMEPQANPMAEWYESMRRIRAQVPADVLVMPAHNECFRGLHDRITQQLEGQDAALDALRELLSTPRRVVDTFATLFRRPVRESDGMQLGLATGEATACLNYLLARGEAEVKVVDGVAWYERSGRR
jgi:glyoxylase-like metal-dependent hydrolase (beta-lactamase superfamily II)